MRVRNLIPVALCAIILFCGGTVLADVTLLCFGSSDLYVVQGRVKGNRIGALTQFVNLPNGNSSEDPESIAVVYELEVMGPNGDRTGPSEGTVKLTGSLAEFGDEQRSAALPSTSLSA